MTILLINRLFYPDVVGTAAGRATSPASPEVLRGVHAAPRPGAAGAGPAS